MKKLFLFIHFSFFIICAHAQPGIDNRWIMGGAGLGGNSEINFISGFPVVDSINLQMYFLVCDGLISDTAGNLLFYTNGCYVANSLADTMINGAGLNPSACTSVYCPFQGGEINRGNLVIPDPGNNNLYHLFHETCDFSTYLYDPTKLYHSIIDMSQQGGLGAVTLKNDVIINNDSLNWGFLTAAKHANGRDWWIAVHELGTNLFYTFLLTPYGLQGPFSQAMGPSYQLDGCGETVFSPDGNKLATTAWGTFSGAKLNVFDFDRCTGLFSNPLFLSIPDSTSSGVAFSPNSRFLYVSPLNTVRQFDLSAVNIQASETVVDTADGTICYLPTNSQTGFLLMQLAYNHKIYIQSSGGCPEFHVINDPDSLGTACNVQLHALQLPHRNDETVPNYPNYRLGGVAGGVCDSLLLGNHEVNGFHLRLNVYPNPSSTGIFYFQFNDIREQIKELTITDITGRIVYTHVRNIYEVNMSDLVKGIYFYKVKTSTGKIVNGKMVRD